LIKSKTSSGDRTGYFKLTVNKSPKGIVGANPTIPTLCIRKSADSGDDEKQTLSNLFPAFSFFFY